MSTSDMDTSRIQTAGPTPGDQTTESVAMQRREIDTTRQDMGRTLERLEDRVSPSRIKERQSDRLRSRWQGMRESVMGSNSGHASSMSQHVGQVGHQAQSAIQDAPERLEGATRGNPFAAGFIAAGVGALLGSLLPASEPERRVAGQLRDEFEEPVRSELQQAGREAGEQLGEHAKESAEEIKQTAQHAADHARQEATDQVEQVRGGHSGAVASDDGPTAQP